VLDFCRTIHYNKIPIQPQVRSRHPLLGLLGACDLEIVKHTLIVLLPRILTNANTQGSMAPTARCTPGGAPQIRQERTNRSGAGKRSAEEDVEMSFSPATKKRQHHKVSHQEQGEGLSNKIGCMVAVEVVEHGAIALSANQLMPAAGCWTGNSGVLQLSRSRALHPACTHCLAPLGTLAVQLLLAAGGNRYTQILPRAYL